MNPLGELEGFEPAAAIVRQYAKPEMVTAYGSQWNNIVLSESAKIIMGEITPQQGIANMQKRFKEEKIYK